MITQTKTVKEWIAYILNKISNNNKVVVYDVKNALINISTLRLSEATAYVTSTMTTLRLTLWAEIPFTSPSGQNAFLFQLDPNKAPYLRPAGLMYFPILRKTTQLTAMGCYLNPISEASIGNYVSIYGSFSLAQGDTVELTLTFPRADKL